MKKETTVKNRFRTSVSDNLRKTISNEIDCKIKQSGLQKKEFAEKIGMSNSALWNIMHNKSIDIGAIELIANALECDVELKLIPKNQEGGTL
ncbi:MAG: helix-turn-helix transcriptional regulator [Oscillospiraceae bacterium]